MNPTSAPSSDQFAAFLDDLRRHRERLTELAQKQAGNGTDELAAMIDEVSEELLVADEEMRVQNEEIVQSAKRFDLLVALHEELFARASTAYVQTDCDGVIIGAT